MWAIILDASEIQAADKPVLITGGPGRAGSVVGVLHLCLEGVYRGDFLFHIFIITGNY